MGGPAAKGNRKRRTKKKRADGGDESSVGSNATDATGATTATGKQAAAAQKKAERLKQEKDDPYLFVVPPLVYAARMGFLPLGRALVSAGADCDILDYAGLSALHWLTKRSEERR